MYSFKGN